MAFTARMWGSVQAIQRLASSSTRLHAAVVLNACGKRCHPRQRLFSSSAEPQPTLGDRNKKLAIYATATAIAVAGLSYAAVPLYQIFCQATGYGGTTQQAEEEKFKNMKPVPGGRQVTVYFNADTSSSMPWKFSPQQRAIKVVPGETALAFYTAHNPTDKPITGVSTYNVSPMRAGLYFNKIQCFCFEEQRLRPHEEIDMPIFFYVDPAFLQDPAMENVKSITLSYTFFRTGDKEVIDIANEIRKQDAGTIGLSGGLESDATRDRIAKWTQAVAERTSGNPAASMTGDNVALSPAASKVTA